MCDVNPIVNAVAAVTSAAPEEEPKVTLTDAVEIAPALVENSTEAPAKVEDAPPLPKDITPKEWKNIMRLYFTVRRNTVEPCGHKLDTNNDPRNNCNFCWFVFFQTHGEMTQTSDEIFQKYGRKALESLRGTKFVKNFLKFMAVLAIMKKQAEAQKENDGRSIGEPGSGGGNELSPETTSEQSSGSTDQQTVVDGGQVEGAGASQESAG
jgi:hypothetical protein